MRRIVSISVLMILLGFGLVRAQIYPVVSTLVMPFPHSPFLFDYYEPGATNMQVTVQLNDFTVPNQRVKLQLEIEGEGINIRTRATYQPPGGILLTPGVPLTLQGSDLYDALNSSDLEFQGLSAAAFNQNGGKLPEGQYNFCFTVLDYNSGKELSLPACANIFIQFEVPPVLLTPTCADIIQPTNPQNIRFSWQVAGMGQPSFFGLNTYVLHVYQITDPNIADPLNAVPNSKAVKVWESQPTSLTALNLDFSTVLLVPGNKYVCRIQGIGPEGKETFQNEGYGEWCWFSYGYAAGGDIPLQEPYDGYQFEKTDPRVFAWEASDKGQEGQSYDYTLTIVELTDTAQGLADAMTNNATFHQENLATTTSQQGANFQLQQPLTADKKYAWRVTASTDGQAVAESEIRSFYSHSLIDHFYAANQKIKVIQTANADLSNFAGKARIQLSGDETDFIDVDFNGLEIQDVAGQMVLKNGQINFDLSGRDPLDIEAELEVNGVGNLEYETGTIDKTGLKVDGKIVWLLPHAVAPGEENEVRSKSSTFVMNSEGGLSGEAGIEPFQTTLLAPKDFVVNLKPTSKLQLSNNELVVQVLGSITLHPDVQTISATPIVIELIDYQNSLDYIEIDNLIGAVNGGVAPISGLGLEMIPIAKGVIDFSEEKSPGKLSSNKAWKGFYVEDFKTRLNVAGFDPSNQLTIPERIDIDQTTDATPFRFWISGTGLNLKTSFDIDGKDGLRFNSFQTETFHGEFEISKGEFKNVKFSGSTKLPFIDDQREFDFQVPTSPTGLEDGYMEGLEDLEFIYNPYGGENRMEFKINRVAFVDHAYLSLNCDIECPELGVVIDGQEDLRIYGDNFIGMSGKNTAVALDDPVTGRFKDLDMTVTDIGAAFLGGQYAMSLSMESFLSDGFSDSEGGPPTFTMSSVAATSAEAAPGSAMPQPDIEVPEGLEGEEAIKPTGFDVKIETPLLDAGAYLLFTGDDPEWGTRFSAGVNASLKIPARYNMGGNMTLGFVDGMDYWYFDVYFEDVDGEGVQVMVPYVGKVTNIVGIEGQIFRHVKSKKTEEGEFELALSPRTQFGAKIFMQFIDPYAKGFLYQADLGLENEIQGDGYVVDNFEQILTGQAAFLNINFRTGSAVSTGAIVETVNELGVADELLDQIFPQSFEMLGQNVTIDSKGLTKGSSIEIGSVEGGEGLRLGAEVSSEPGLEIGVAYGGYKIIGAGDASGSAKLDLEVAGLDLKAELIEKSAGSFSLDIGDLSTSFSGDYAKKKADFAFDYQDVNFAAGINAPLKAGYFDVGFDGKKIGAHANVTAKTGGVNLEFDDKKFFLDVDGNALSSDFKLQYGDYKFENALNISQKKGSLLLVTPIGEVDIAGSTTGAKFRAEADDYLFHVEADFPSKTGKLAMAFPNHELRGELLTDRGKVFLKKDDFEIGLGGKFDGTGGDLHVKEGNFIFDIGADITDETGYLTLATGNETFASNYNLADTSFIRFSNSSDLYEAVLRGAYFRSQIVTTDNHFLLEFDKDKVAGKTLFQIPSFLVGTEFDASKNAASARLQIQDHKINSAIKNDSMAIGYTNGGLEFRVAGKANGGGSVYFADASENLATGFSFDIVDKAGSILFQKDGLSIDLAGNKAANTGHIDLGYNDDFFRAGLEDSLYVATKVDAYGFSAMKSSDKMAASFSYADNEVSVAKLSNGESLRLVIPSNAFAISRDGSDYAASYAGDNLAMSAFVKSNEIGFGFEKDGIEVDATANSDKVVAVNYKDSGIDVGVSGDLDDAVFGTTVSKDGWTGSVSTALKTKEVTLGLSKSGISVDGTFKASEKVLEYELGDVKIEGGFAGSVPVMELALGAAELDFGALLGGNVAMGAVQLDIGSIHADLGNLSLGSSPEFNIDFSGTSFNIQEVSGANACAIDLTRDNNPVAFLGNQFEETINGNLFKVTLNPDDSKNILVQTSDLSVDFTYKCDELPAIKVNKDGKQYAFVVKNDEVLLQYDDNVVSYAEENHELKVQKGSEYSFMVNDEALETDLNGYYLKFNDDEFTAGTGGTYVLLSDDKAAIHADDKFIELNSNDTYKIQVDPNKYITTTASSLEVKVDSKRLFVGDSEFSASDTQEQFDVSLDTESLSIAKGDALVVASASEVRFEKGEDFVSVSNEALGAKYDDKRLTISADKKVSYKDDEREFAASESSLYLDYQGKILEVKKDEVRLELASDQKFKVRENLVSAQYGQYKVDLVDPLGSPSFAYSDDNNSLGISGSEVSILIDGKGVTVGQDKLHVLYDDHYLKYQENDLSFKYGRYLADFTDWSAVNLTNGVQQFGISPNELTAALDANNKVKVVTDPSAPSVELIHDDTRFALSTEKAEFDYDGMHYALGKVEYIRVNEIGKPDEGFVFTEDGIKYKFNNTDFIKVAPKDDFIRLQLDNKYVSFRDDYSLRFGLDDYHATIYKDLSIIFSDGGDHSIELNKDDYMVGYTYVPKDIYLRLKRFEDNYIGLQAGMDKYGGFVKPAEDNSIEIGGIIDGLGQASVAVNADKDITGKLKNSESNFLALKVAKAKTLEKIHVKVSDLDIINYGGEVDVFGEDLPGVAAVGGDGPSHIAVLAEKAGGWAVGGLKFRRTIGTNLAFVAQGRIQTGLTLPMFCANAAFAAEIRANKVRLKVAGKNDYASFRLLCIPGLPELYSETGYVDLGYDASTQGVSFDVALGYRIGAGASGSFSVDVLGCSIGISAGFDAYVGFGGQASLSIPFSSDASPELSLGPIFAEVGASAYLKAHACGFSIGVSAGISGRLELEGDLEGASAEGMVSGHFSACGLSKSFDFNAKLEI